MRFIGALSAAELRNFYALADVVVLPSIPTRNFLEPWGLVINEAMNQRVAVITSDAVGAAAGGLVRDLETGLVTMAGDSVALSRALVRLQSDSELRSRIAARAADEVTNYSPERWAEQVALALELAGGG